MGNTNLERISEEVAKELDMSCFLCDQLEIGLAIILYPDDGQPQRINIEKDFNFIVENNQLEITDGNKTVLKLDKLSEYDYVDWDKHIKFYSLVDNTVIKIAALNSITEEEDALCIQ